MNMLSKMSPFAALLKDFMVEIDKTQIVGWSFLYKGNHHYSNSIKHRPESINQFFRQSKLSHESNCNFKQWNETHLRFYFYRSVDEERRKVFD